MRSKYESNTKALDKMLRNQKQSKDTGGLGFEEGQSYGSNDLTCKEIQFTTSEESKNKHVFTVSKPERKRTYVATTRNAATTRNQSVNQNAAIG